MISFRRTLSYLLSVCAVFCGCTGAAEQPARENALRPPLTADQVAENLERRNAQRAQRLVRLQGRRVYRLEYHGFPGDRNGEMLVECLYTSPATKEFKIVSWSGSQFVLDRIFRKLLDSEQEASQPENQKRAALTRENYRFTLVGYQQDPEGPSYVLQVEPKSNEKFLYRGKIWVDGRDFAVKRIEAEPAKSPSFWTKNSEVLHEYRKFGDFWLPVRNQSVSSVRFGGKATLSIEYRDYRIETRTSHSIGAVARSGVQPNTFVDPQLAAPLIH